MEESIAKNRRTAHQKQSCLYIKLKKEHVLGLVDCLSITRMQFQPLIEW